ncbi:MAG: zinc-finger domain-containing protein [Gammaproteobacteria bacterium]|nr:zinc-finger domain-containing protein [Gammaproteobacteria bacterium]
MSDNRHRESKSGATDPGRARTITRDQLPLHCPTPDMPLWSSHPRVYLPIEDSGEETCPYCGAVYTLVEQDPS